MRSVQTLVCLVAVGALVTGCRLHGSTAGSNYGWKGKKAEDLDTIDLAEINLAQGNVGAWGIVALQALPKEETFSAGRRCDLHGIALEALALYSTTLVNIVDPSALEQINKAMVAAGQGALPTNVDEIAERSLGYVESNCAARPDRHVQALVGYSRYLALTSREGKAMTQARKALAAAPAGSVQQMIAQNEMANLLDAAGEFELRDAWRQRALQTGREVFQFQPAADIKPQIVKRYGLDSPEHALDYGAEAVAFAKVIDARMEELSLASKPDPEAIHRLWIEMEGPSSLSFGSGAGAAVVWHPLVVVRMARAGDVERAKALLAKLEPSYHDPAHRVEFVAARAAIAGAEGRTADAADLWRQFIERNWPGAVQIGASAVSVDDLTVAGLAQERAGKVELAIEFLSQAVEGSERARSSYTVESRARFLRGTTIKAYWGLLRTYARRFRTSGKRADYARALDVAQKLTARQFGEVLGVGDKAIEPGKLELAPDELLLQLVSTDAGIVVFSFSPSSKTVALVELAMEEHSAAVGRLRDALRRPVVTDWQADALAISNAALSGLAGQLGKARRITVIADGQLATVPFALLSVPGASYRPLLEVASIQMAPSLSFLAAQRRKRAPSTSGLFALANPTYGKRAVPRAAENDRGSYTRAIDALGLFTPLPETEREVAILVKAFGKNAVTSVVRKDASESRVKAMNLSQFRLLHFATHGVLGDQIPGVREPALVLAAEPKQDGFLTMSEVQALDLSAELTVLSACDTGSGVYYDGEGVMGLGRAFLLAGSDSVLATYWPINSLATVTFMEGFYKKVGKGVAKEDALRQTQLEFLRGGIAKSKGERGLVLDTGEPTRAANAQIDASGRHPYYWAPFVLIGGR